MQYLEFRAMNTDIVLAAEGDAESVARGFADAAAFIRMSEARLTRFSETSELAKLNRSGGEWFTVSEELYGIVSSARQLHIQTGGLFDPAILDALEKIGYDTSMDTLRANGAKPWLPGQSQRMSVAAVEFDSSSNRLRMPAGMRLDLGGIAKGWIAEEAAKRLAAVSTACAVNAGGDMFMIGVPGEDGCWKVTLDDPRDDERALAILRSGPGAIATSSVTRRRWKQGKFERHHLIDPRTGLSAETDWLSVTVLTEHADVAEVFAKALLIAGSAVAPHLAQSRSDIAYIAVDRKGNMWGSDRAKEFLDVGN